MPGILLIIFILAIYFLYKYSTRNYNYWKDKGIPYVKPIPFIGNFLDVFTFRKNIASLLSGFYNAFPNAPYVGIFALNKPFLVLRCPDLIKSVLVKDFNYFTDRNFVCDEKIDSISANFIPFMKNPEWKQLRGKMSPVFTISKVKNMTNLMRDVVDEMIDYIEKHRTEGAIDVKKISYKSSTDVIATCAFGVKAHSFQRENAEFEFIGKIMFNVNWKGTLIQSCYFVVPSVIKFFKLPFFDTRVRDFGRRVFWEVVEERKKTNVKRNDVIDVINEIREIGLHQDDIPFDGDRVVAQPLMFFGAGFETTGTTMMFALYELCLNTHIQDKIRDEVKAVLSNHKDLNYEALQELKYMEQVLYETMRKYPVIPFLDRVCVKDYEIPNSKIVLEKGTSIFIPSYALHWDPEYFPNPEVFDPERFSDRNKELPYYFAFGAGPRACMGVKFAMLEMKIALSQLLIKFELEKCLDTPIKLKFVTDYWLIQVKGALPITFKKITEI